MFGHVCACLCVFGHVCACSCMLGHAWACLGMFGHVGHVWACSGMFGHVWLCFRMFRHECARVAFTYLKLLWWCFDTESSTEFRPALRYQECQRRPGIGGELSFAPVLRHRRVVQLLFFSPVVQMLAVPGVCSQSRTLTLDYKQASKHLNTYPRRYIPSPIRPSSESLLPDHGD